ncbi:MAG: hypothetical protein V7K15_20415 [Nostoc sp.]
MQTDLTPFPTREGGKIQSLSPKRREVKTVPHPIENRYKPQLYRDEVMVYLILISKGYN